MVAPTQEIVLSIVVGAVVGFIFCQLIRNRNTTKDVLILTFATIMIATGLSIRLHLSLILTNMVVGFVMVNTRREALVHTLANGECRHPQDALHLDIDRPVTRVGLRLACTQRSDDSHNEHTAYRGHFVPAIVARSPRQRAASSRTATLSTILKTRWSGPRGPLSLLPVRRSLF